MQKTVKSSIAHDEISRFSAQADDWWKPDGVFAPLHRLNPLRLGYIKDQVNAYFGSKNEGRRPLKGFDILDVGCGGGILTEPLTRMGGKVTGLDASSRGLEVAKAHALKMGLSINYQKGTVEEFARSKKTYDVVTALEIVEHVADRKLFIKALTDVVRPGGLLIMSTLNRTPRSFLFGILAAEYILRWVPRGTHSWKKFVRPSELVADLEDTGMQTLDLSGLSYNPLKNVFDISQTDTAVNYMLTAQKPL